VVLEEGTSQKKAVLLCSLALPPLFVPPLLFLLLFYQLVPGLIALEQVLLFSSPLPSLSRSEQLLPLSGCVN
jgi:hypothetical protein